MLRNGYRSTTATVVPTDDAYEAGWRAALHGERPLYATRSRANLDAFNRGYQGGAAERQRIVATQTRQAMPLPRAVVVDAWLHGVAAAQRGAAPLFGGDRRIGEAYRAGYDSYRSGDVVRDKHINWRGGWRVRPLDADPSTTRQLVNALLAEDR